MFAIFKNKKQCSELLSTLELAFKLAAMHRKDDDSSIFEIKAKVHAKNKDGMQRKTKAGKNSTQWVSLDECQRRFNEAESKGLF